MITPVITIVKNALTDAINTFKQNANVFIQDIYAGLPQAQNELLAWFTNPQKQILILEGYPEHPQQIPCIAISPDNTVEIDMYTGQQELLQQQGNGWNMYLGTTFRSQVTCLCLAENYNLAYYLSLLTRWALLWERNALAASGLTNQKISVEEVEPAEIYINRGGMQDVMFVFQFAVTLTCEHLDSITINLPQITQVTTQVTAK